MEKIKGNFPNKENKVSPNMHRVVVHLYNPPRKGVNTGKGSKDFKTTHTFNDIKTFEGAFEIINHFAEGKADGHINYSMIKRAYYNGAPLVSDGVWIAKD